MNRLNQNNQIFRRQNLFLRNSPSRAVAVILASESLFLGVVNIVLPCLCVEDRNELSFISDISFINVPLTLSITYCGNSMSHYIDLLYYYLLNKWFTHVHKI